MTYFGGDFQRFRALDYDDLVSVLAFDRVSREPKVTPKKVTYKDMIADIAKRDDAVKRMRANGSSEAGIARWLAAAKL